MPHLVILYTPDIDRKADMPGLCRALADVMVEAKTDEGKQVFPTGGVRVLAYPAAHSAVADGKRDYAFAYLNLRMARGRTDAVKRRVGEHLMETTRAYLKPMFEDGYLGVTLHIDEGHEVVDVKESTIHPLFAKV
jgi:5-carboxymethyl-2-hydroxymuconate isomerase